MYLNSNIFHDTFDFDNCFSYKFLKVDAYEYRAGLMLILDKFVLEIKEILSTNSINFFFICRRYDIICFNYSLNSLEISPIANEYKLIDLNIYPKVYEKRLLLNKMFIIADTLEVYNEFIV